MKCTVDIPNQTDAVLRNRDTNKPGAYVRLDPRPDYATHTIVWESSGVLQRILIYSDGRILLRDAGAKWVAEAGGWRRLPINEIGLTLTFKEND